MEASLVIPLNSKWDGAEFVRRQVLTALADFPPEVRDAAAMTASELAENAIKYGGSEAELGYHAHLSLSADPAQVLISVASRASGAEISGLARHIAELQQAADLQSLYLARLQEMLSSPQGQGGHLGLLRVAYEGQFQLAYSFREPFLTITAKRALS